jgi:hypothetical protein
MPRPAPPPRPAEPAGAHRAPRHGDGAPTLDDLAPRAVRGFNRWNARHRRRGADRRIGARRRASDGGGFRERPFARRRRASRRRLDFPVAGQHRPRRLRGRHLRHQGRELFYLRQCLEKLGLRVVTVDLSTSGKPSPASVHPREVARHHPQGESAVFSGDRGSAVTAMALAFEHFVRTRRDLGGIISAGGSGGTSLATPGMRALPIGVPKVMVSPWPAATRGPTSGRATSA